ncbi:aminodeoxychorismate/anthranilate synthase component II [Streptomyces sp. ICN988]|uniref:anthranilate synthase component II n=1 Tax=unclassified Streptomyces TaxID=2593676 RepID=UPI0021E49677|nr:aminodeoxychorismate/anthranilate synthase component II [Streptomyces sp. ICN988]MCV2458632.1 aminodeoxychorismate/anthranilate synthase component II [Streptomyces sp. ICN988]
MKVLLIDAFDSFVHIIRQYLLTTGVDVVVVRAADVDAADLPGPGTDAVVLGPGPGTPDDHDYPRFVRATAGRVPLLGVCLGHQAVAAAHGAVVRPAERIMHGKTSGIEHDGRGVFTGVPDGFTATRYHSLVVVEETLPGELEVSARSQDDGYVMGLRHRRLPVESVQFHPESVCTRSGLRLIENFVRHAADWTERRAGHG